MRIIGIIIAIMYSVTLSAQERITLLFVGDLMLHDAQIKAARTLQGYDYSDCFKHVKEEISRADIAVANLEVVMGGKPYRGYPSFSAPDEFLYAVKEAGFDVLLTGNNHCLDRGSRGLRRTVQMLDSLNIPFAGTYMDVEERQERYPLLVEKNGFRIAFLNYTYGTNGLEPQPPHIVNYIDKERIKEDISTARRMQPDAIIACMHWGMEYRRLPQRSEKELADWLIEQGVDHVIGSHPHVLQPMEIRRDEHTPAKHAVVYSLGNFISNMTQENTDGGAMVRMELVKTFNVVQLVKCEYSLVWTSRPILSGKTNYEVYPASYIDKLIDNKEYIPMKRFLENTRSFYRDYNKNIKEYFFE